VELAGAALAVVPVVVVISWLSGTDWAPMKLVSPL
jgi:hypothetical protein